MGTDGPFKAELKAEVQVGKRSVEKLIDAAVDAFSPATESLGLLGDAVRLARVEVAAAITKKAKQIADAQGLKLSAPPLKFLIPFYEKASTENLEDDTLVSMRARLLTSAGSKYDARYLRYSNLLSEMSATQARVLQGMATNYGGDIGDVDALVYNMVESRLLTNLKRVCGHTKNPDELFKRALTEICCAGVSVVLLTFVVGDDQFDWADDKVYSDQVSVDFDILRSLGLIERVSTDFVPVFEDVEILVILYHITELGYDFWRACCGNQQKHDASG